MGTLEKLVKHSPPARESFSRVFLNILRGFSTPVNS